MDWNLPERVFGPSLDASVLRALWQAGSHLTGAQVHRLTSTGSERGVRYALERLVAHGIVTSWSVGAANVYDLNREHLTFPALDAAYRALNPWAELARRVEQLVVEIMPPAMHEGRLQPPDVTVCVFGSVARGDATPDSDLDLLVVVPDGSSGDHLVDQLEIHARRWTGQRVQTYLTSPSELLRAKGAGDPIVVSFAREARRLYGPPLEALKETR